MGPGPEAERGAVPKGEVGARPEAEVGARPEAELGTRPETEETEPGPGERLPDIGAVYREGKKAMIPGV